MIYDEYYEIADRFDNHDNRKIRKVLEDIRNKTDTRYVKIKSPKQCYFPIIPFKISNNN